ncbi:MAG: dihydroorotase [Bacteroidota bacterium]
MDILLKNVMIIDVAFAKEATPQDILIKNGRIEQIGKGLVAVAGIPQKDVKGACASIGWMDVGVQTGDPGFEHREDHQSVAKAAAAGGFTAIGCQPNNFPVTDHKTAVHYITRNTAHELVDFFPIGAITKDCKGTEITEMIDMHHAGAIAFSDGEHPVQHAGVMMRALQYVKSFDGIVINLPIDQTLSHHGQMHEGMMSTSLGMRGIPALAETLAVQRDIDLLEYCDSKLHFAAVSSAKSIELIRAAKANGLALTAAVPAINLAFTDEQLLDFDTHYKVMPPLRSQADQEALIAALADGTIDLVSSMHHPQDEEAKKLEFPYANFGALGLQTAFAVVNTTLNWEPAQLVKTLAIRPRQIFKLPIPELAVGAPANLTLFDPSTDWQFTPASNHSKSANSPFFGYPLKGKVLGVINNNQAYFAEE